MKPRRDIFDILGIPSEEDLKIWTQIQRVKAASNANPGHDVKDQLTELSRDYYDRTGANGR